MYRIGLSGGVGCGKSTVSSYLKELGIPIIDGNMLAREAVRPVCVSNVSCAQSGFS